MKKLLVCQHVAHEALGTLAPLFKGAGFRIRYVNFGRQPDLKPSLEGYDGLVILGGPMNVDETSIHPHLVFEVTMIQEALKRNLPVLGICLGAQLIAKALGGRVAKNPVKEIGWYDVALTAEGKNDPILKHFKPAEKIFQWHGDTFDIPSGAVHLLSSQFCLNQAFRFGDRVYGFQFHLEVDRKMIERWLRVPDNRREIEASDDSIDSEAIRRETPLHIDHLKKLGDKIFGEFIRRFGAEKKFKRLPSR
ncbi:MAG: gamma-glutamyl-gamma-aminobutyrate hydrolase family protein [Deltaproteobacteria bacterium]|nr:gamma-glutamyl-gamma-aminobutyrate hydrolase family protein [Deltaproteobacteria bacterium]